MMPERSTADPRANRAPMARIAGLLKWANASLGSITLARVSAVTPRKATISGGSFSQAKRKSMVATVASTMAIGRVTIGFLLNKQAEGWYGIEPPLGKSSF